MAQQTAEADDATGDDYDSDDPITVAEREASDLDLPAALEELRAGIDGYGDRISAGAAVLRATDDLAIPSDVISHPKVEQTVWRYEHDAETVHGEIQRTIERYHDDDDDEPVDSDEIVAALRVAAARIDTPISTD